MDDMIDDERIGYGRPPSWMRFRKGRSGNPKGRPAKTKAAPKAPAIGQSATDEIVRRELNRTVKINDANGGQTITMLEAVTRAQTTAAAKGNVFAQQQVLKLAREVEARDVQRAAEAEGERAEDFGRIVSLCNRQRKAWDAATIMGSEPVDPWPHPDDILIDEKTQQWKIRGPNSETDIPLFNYFRAQRDLMFWLMIRAIRKKLGKGRGTARGSSRAWEYFLIVMLGFDNMLPKRWQIQSDLEEAMGLIGALSLRDVGKQVALWENEVGLLAIAARVPEPDRECQQFAAKIMKPLVNRYGYRSLAQFERDYEEKGDRLKLVRRT